MDLDAETGADVVHLLVRLALDRDASAADAHDRRKTLADQLDVRSETRAFADDRRVDIADRIARAADLLDDRLQQLRRIGVLPARVRVGKVRADVAEGRRAEERVDDRVDQHVRVTVSLEPRLARELDAAEDKALLRLPVGSHPL